MKVLIVGAGIGGLTLASFLEYSNVEYDIVEKAPDWSHMGFIIGIWESGRNILQKLGLAEEFDHVGTRTTRYLLKDKNGDIVKSVDLRPLIAEYGSAITLLDRGDLHRLLLSKLNSTRVKMSMTVEKLTQTSEAVGVSFSDGTTGSYDVVVGADGIHSQIRTLEFEDAIESFENWRIWYTWVGHEYDSSGVVSEYVDAGRFVIVCTAGKKTTAWFFAPADHSLWDKTEGRAARLRALFKNEPLLLPALEKLRDEDIVPTDMMRLKLSTWSKGRTVLLGDASHSLGPLAGMGSSMAMEDAYTLAAELMRVSDVYPLARAFKNYEKFRRPRIREVETMSRNLKLGVLVSSPAWRHITNALMTFVPERVMVRNISYLMRQEI